MAEGAARTRGPRAVAAGADLEMVRLLGLAASQIEVALREAEAPVAALGELIAGLGDSAAGRAGASALQYHDRLSQRLTHVRDTLSALAEFLGAPGEHTLAADWDQLRADIRSRYSMEQERLIFDLLVRGSTPAEVLQALADLRVGGAAGHVDLF
jgi:hypothetical protein